MDFLQVCRAEHALGQPPRRPAPVLRCANGTLKHLQLAKTGLVRHVTGSTTTVNRQRSVPQGQRQRQRFKVRLHMASRGKGHPRPKPELRGAPARLQRREARSERLQKSHAVVGRTCSAGCSELGPVCVFLVAFGCPFRVPFIPTARVRKNCQKLRAEALYSVFCTDHRHSLLSRQLHLCRHTSAPPRPAPCLGNSGHASLGHGCPSRYRHRIFLPSAGIIDRERQA